MKPREVKLARRVAVDYLLIGMAIGGSANAMQTIIAPEEMLSDVGKRLMKSALEGKPSDFRNYFETRHTFRFSPGENVGQGLIRLMKESNIDQSAYAISECMAEQLNDATSIEDTIEILNRATEALEHSLAAKKEMQ